MDAFAKLAAEALVTPDELEARAKRDRWKKWLAVAAGGAALGGAAYGIHKNWDGISKGIDKLLPGMGTKPGPIADTVHKGTGLSTTMAGAATWGGLGGFYARARDQFGGLKRLTNTIAAKPEHLKGDIDNLDATLATDPKQPGGSAAKALREAAADPTHALHNFKNLDAAAAKIDPATKQPDAAAVSQRDALRDIHRKQVRQPFDLGRAAKRGLVGGAVGYGIQSAESAVMEHL